MGPVRLKMSELEPFQAFGLLTFVELAVCGFVNFEQRTSNIMVTKEGFGFRLLLWFMG